MENWEHEESIKELKSEIAKVKRSHKYFEQKLKKQNQSDLDFVERYLQGATEILLNSNCEKANEALRLLEIASNQATSLISQYQRKEEMSNQLANIQFQKEIEKQIQEHEKALN